MDIPNIQKQRKHLAKLVLDMDSARTRCESSLNACTITWFMVLLCPLLSLSIGGSSHASPPVTPVILPQLGPKQMRSERRWRRRPIAWRSAGYLTLPLLFPLSVIEVRFHKKMLSLFSLFKIIHFRKAIKAVQMIIKELLN